MSKFHSMFSVEGVPLCETCAFFRPMKAFSFSLDAEREDLQKRLVVVVNQANGDSDDSVVTGLKIPVMPIGSRDSLFLGSYCVALRV